ncbi:putative odorant receptor OR10 [Danaus plexippus plexippus]|uniref:Odorant receptor n=1 Tax=Danaus plexippus plexippus TaxID=278856 RepID=A0A212EZS0_DANPL|nr:putative odorant receptor OR10 [Danaus plexippus plexippus]
MGIWLSSNNYVILRDLYKSLIMSTQYSFLLFEIFYVFVVWGDIDEMSEASYLLFTQTSVCYKASVFIINKKNLIVLLVSMKAKIFEPQSSIHYGILYRNARVVKNLCAVFLMSAITTCSLWTIMPLFDAAETRFFPFKIWMPVDPRDSPQYELGYIYQVMSIYISALLFVAVDNITLGMIMFGCAQLEIVIDKIKQLKNASSKHNKERRKLICENNKLLDECIKQHQSVIRFIETLENTYHANIFFQLTATVGIICIIGLRISIVEPRSVQFFSMLNYMVTMLSQLFLYCWCGSHLTTKSEELREWLYQCPWYNQDPRFRKSVFIAMERMKRPIIFKAGHYIPLSRPTFVSVLRLSYSYFAVLNQAKNK